MRNDERVRVSDATYVHYTCSVQPQAPMWAIQLRRDTTAIGTNLTRGHGFSGGAPSHGSQWSMFQGSGLAGPVSSPAAEVKTAFDYRPT